ncbi:regulator of microtubule dynamics protein 2 isoform X1 [Myotis daubentonii]|uniref:regulator of microtubule dynamics protein 2 isoform X1 n=1 Tax=Myotis daubentonii TaxID=98922 RepID=UPI002873A639|nr:regulator of microtubule dynamics protein 2 isoform X1 [Myotis daubentonii]
MLFNFRNNQEMPHSTNKELILGIMVGTTGISLLLLWYHKVCKPRTAVNLPKFLSLGNAFDLVTSQDEMQNDQGTAAIYQGRQLQILEKLNELLTNMEELREEIRILKETIPKLEECVCGELGGKTTAHRISPQHRTRKRRLATVQSSGTSNSSEETESEGGCNKKDQNFQQYCPEDHVTSDPLHHGTSSVTYQPNVHDLPANYSKLRKVSIRTGSKNFTTPSSISAFSSFSDRHSLFSKFQKSSVTLQRQESRANFDSEDKSSLNTLKTSPEHFAFTFRRHFSARKLSIISCYESSMYFDLQSSSENMNNPSETQVDSKSSTIADVEKYLSSCSPDYNIKHFISFETKVHSSANPIDAARVPYRQSTATFISLPTLISYSYEQREIASDTQERSQPKKKLLPADVQSHRAGRPLAVIQQQTSESATSVPPNVAVASFYKPSRRFTPVLIEVHSNCFGGGSIAQSSQDEDKSSPIEIPNLRSPQILSSLRRAAQIGSFPTRCTL